MKNYRVYEWVDHSRTIIEKDSEYDKKIQKGLLECPSDAAKVRVREYPETAPQIRDPNYFLPN